MTSQDAKQQLIRALQSVHCIVVTTVLTVYQVPSLKKKVYKDISEGCSPSCQVNNSFIDCQVNHSLIDCQVNHSLIDCQVNH